MTHFIADSSSDRPVIAGLPVQYVPLIISTEEKSFTDDASLDVSKMLDYLAAHKGRSYTACPSAGTWLNAFGEADTVYAVTITSGLSGSCNAAMAARDLYLQAHPNAQVAVFDSLSTGPELRLILEKLKELTDQNLPFEQVVDAVREYQKKTRLFFILQSLHNLAQNGRVSKVAATAVGMLGIRIVGTASPAGTLAQLAKCRGDRKALREMLDLIHQAGYAGGKIRITHVENAPLAEVLASLIRENWSHASINVAPSGGLCSYYAERGAILVAIET